MPVTLGARPEHGFDQPLGLLSDCHRRIERFLDVMLRVVDRARSRELIADERAALDAALAYFNTAAPRHTADEEDSLFPRLRRSNDPAVRSVMARLDALEADHRDAEAAHGEVERWCRRWLEQGRLAPPQVRRLSGLLQSLRDLYRAHIELEDHEVFPLAARTLSHIELADLGLEMAQRRGHASSRPELARKG